MLFTTGEFAKIANVSKRMLFYYAQQKIFSPCQVGENGYHYYSDRQFYTFSLIRALRELGMSIRELKEYLQNKNATRLIELLEPKEQQLTLEIQQKQRLQQLIHIKLETLRNSADIDFSVIAIQELPEVRILLSHPLDNLSLTQAEHCLHGLAYFCMKQALNIGYPIGRMMSRDALLAGTFTCYSHYFKRIDAKNIMLDSLHAQLFMRPAGYYVIGYAQGSDDVYPEIYACLLSFIQEHHLTVKGFAYEEPLLDDLCVQDPQDSLTRIMINVAD